MAPIPGEPQESPKPQPIGSFPMIVLFTTCTLCGLFLLWRKADTFREVVSHQLKTIHRSEGRIRLSVDDGPPSNEFLADDYDDDNEYLNDTSDEPLSEHIQKNIQAQRQPKLVEDEGAIIVLPSSTVQPSR